MRSWSQQDTLSTHQLASSSSLYHSHLHCFPRLLAQAWVQSPRPRSHPHRLKASREFRPPSRHSPPGRVFPMSSSLLRCRPLLSRWKEQRASRDEVMRQVTLRVWINTQKPGGGLNPPNLNVALRKINQISRMTIHHSPNDTPATCFFITRSYKELSTREKDKVTPSIHRITPI